MTVFQKTVTILLFESVVFTRLTQIPVEQEESREPLLPIQWDETAIAASSVYEIEVTERLTFCEIVENCSYEIVANGLHRRLLASLGVFSLDDWDNDAAIPLEKLEKR